MQKTFTILISALFLTIGAFAQEPACTPGQISPDTAIILPIPFNEGTMMGGLDSTCIGMSYEQVLTALTPQSIPFGGTEIAVDSISIDTVGAIGGLPPGFEYACNPPNCVFVPDSVGCIVIFGEADENVPPATYELVLNINAFNFIFPQGVELEFPGALGNPNAIYFIDVASEEDCNLTTSTSEFQQSFVSNLLPNPTDSYAELFINSLKEMETQFVVLDVLGKVVQQRKVSIQVGQNNIPIEVQDLPQGIYFLSLTDGKEFISHKLVVER